MSERRIKVDELRTCENCGDNWGWWDEENDMVLCPICEPSVLKGLFETTPTQKD